MITTVSLPPEILETLSKMPGGTKYQAEKMIAVFHQNGATRKERMISSLRAIREKLFGDVSEKMVFAVEKITTIVNPNFYKFEGKKKELALDAAALAATVTLVLGGLVMIGKISDMTNKDSAEISTIIKEAVHNETRLQENALAAKQQMQAIGLDSAIKSEIKDRPLLFERNDDLGDIIPSTLKQ